MHLPLIVRLAVFLNRLPSLALLPVSLLNFLKVCILVLFPGRRMKLRIDFTTTFPQLSETARQIDDLTQT